MCQSCFLNYKTILDFEAFFYLGVKGVELKLISAFERFLVDLFKSYPVELTLKDVDFQMK